LSLGDSVTVAMLLSHRHDFRSLSWYRSVTCFLLLLLHLSLCFLWSFYEPPQKHGPFYFSLMHVPAFSLHVLLLS
jgi:hypothetical protein